MEMDNAIRVNDEGDVSICDAEILDELTTSELNVRNHSFKEDKRAQSCVRRMQHEGLLIIFWTLLVVTVLPTVSLCTMRLQAQCLFSLKNIGCCRTLVDFHEDGCRGFSSDSWAKQGWNVHAPFNTGGDKYAFEDEIQFVV